MVEDRTGTKCIPYTGCIGEETPNCNKVGSSSSVFTLSIIDDTSNVSVSHTIYKVNNQRIIRTWNIWREELYGRGYRPSVSIVAK